MISVSSKYTFFLNIFASSLREAHAWTKNLIKFTHTSSHVPSLSFDCFLMLDPVPVIVYYVVVVFIAFCVGLHGTFTIQPRSIFNSNKRGVFAILINHISAVQNQSVHIPFGFRKLNIIYRTSLFNNLYHN